MNRPDNIAIRNTRALDKQYAAAQQMIQDGIAALPVALACGTLTAALANHPDITPRMLHDAGNLLSRLADELERD